MSMLRDYEMTFVVSTTLDEDATAATLERVNQLVLNGQGTVTEVQAWGRRRLAYPIEHQRDGFYVTTRFSMPTESVSALNNDLRLNESILRHLIVRQDEVPIKPAASLAAPSGATPASVPTAPDAELSDGDSDEVPATEDEEPDTVEDEVVPAAEDE